MEGIILNPEEGEKLKKSVENLGGRYRQQKVCRFCADSVVFTADNKNRVIPHDIDGTPHWKTCPYESLTQKRSSFNILKKVAVFFCLKQPDVDIATDLGLSEKEGKVMHAILEKVIKTIEDPTQDQIADKVDGDLTFTPEPNDPIGDPDEDLAPDEELIDATPEGAVLKKLKEKSSNESDKEE